MPDNLTITLSPYDRQLLTDLLSEKINAIPYNDRITIRTEFNAIVELRARINGTLQDVDTNADA